MDEIKKTELTARGSFLDESLQAYRAICEYPTERDQEIDPTRASDLIDPDYRQETLDTMYPPEAPVHQPHPSLVLWTRQLLVRTAVCLALFGIVVLLAEVVLDIQPDYDPWTASSEGGASPSGYVTETGHRTIVRYILWDIVPLYWFIALIVNFKNLVLEWRKADIVNRNRKEIYEWSCDMHQNRPTVQDYKLFCQHYVGPNVGMASKGDMVASALSQVNIPEEFVAQSQGKIYFYASFIDRDELNQETRLANEVLRTMVINICVALRDCMVCLSATWDTTTNEPPLFKEYAVMYNRISEFRADADSRDLKILCDGKVTASFSYGWEQYPSLFPYQSIDPRDPLTYSRTRTSDFSEFMDTLLRLHKAERAA